MGKYVIYDSVLPFKFKVLKDIFSACLAQTMDDMVFQCNNQNSIYVLNASYSAYGVSPLP